MIVKRIDDLLHTPHHVSTPNWESTRLLLASDDMGFSMDVTRMYAGRETHIRYGHHLQAVYCMQGIGEVVASNGRIHPINPGTLFAVDQNDHSILRAITPMVCVSVFNPPPRRVDESDVRNTEVLHG